MAKKTYKAPTVKAIKIAAADILATSGGITTGGNPPLGDDNYGLIGGYDNGQGGWGVGSPD